ncbi:hypothetical protein RclHR1_00750008 [Rhizophagus clarus]|uniref:Uncharacterized protein n=1 Tax=Rhizophagus clarus TaxID=94130 RepID=A0A2Z6RXD6_9GLOM|nr:hypothetical protein RclHR1_00750008 [Rhizophagus clarus]GES85862.1 hypothetical protein GLOIN_2v1871426 [Rhizophagus clarus]
MDYNPSENSVNILNVSNDDYNDNNEFNDYCYPNNLQQTTNVVEPSYVSYDCYDDNFATTNDNIMQETNMNEQNFSQYTPQHIDQDVNEQILNQEPPQHYPQYDINYPQIEFIEIPGYKIIIIPTFSPYKNLNNLDIQEQNQNDQNYIHSSSSNIVIDDDIPFQSFQSQQYQQFQQ